MLNVTLLGVSIALSGTIAYANNSSWSTSDLGSYETAKDKNPDHRKSENPSTAPIPALPGAIKKVLEQLKLDAYGTALNREYERGMAPVAQDATDKEDIFFDDPKFVGQTFQCKSFLIANNNGKSPPVLNLTYSFSNVGTGSLFRENSSKDAQVRLFTILADTKEPTNLKKFDVIGQNDGRSYYEKIRITKRGDLIIEGSTPEKFWAETLLALVGLLIPDFDKYKDAIDKELDYLKLKVALFGLSGMVLNYVYCPHDPIRFQELEIEAQKIMMEKLQSDPKYYNLQNQIQ